MQASYAPEHVLATPQLLAQVDRCLRVEAAKHNALRLIEWCCRSHSHGAQRWAECGVPITLRGLLVADTASSSNTDTRSGQDAVGGIDFGFRTAVNQLLAHYFPLLVDRE
jgi:hypothetical protein